MSKSNKIYVLIFLLALGLHVAALFSFEKEESLLYVNDSYTYVQVAKNLVEHGVYSMEISPTPHPDNFRTPLYPIFLTPFIALGTSFYYPAVVQILIFCVFTALFYYLSKQLFSHRVALVASVLFSLEPFTALITSQILTEAIFTPLFTGSLLLLAIYTKTKEYKSLLLASILLSLAALARPIAFYLFVFIPFAVFIAHYKKIPWKSLGISLGIFFLIFSPWLLFNFFKLNTWQVSSVPNLQVYAYHATYLDSWRASRGATDRLPIVDLDPINDTLDARAIPAVQSVGLNYLKTHAKEYALFHLIRIPALFTDSGYASILNGLPGLNLNFDSSAGGTIDHLLQGRLDELYGQVSNKFALTILYLADIFFILAAILAILSPAISYSIKRKVPKESLFLVLVIIVYSVIASPIGGARFRIPINPILFLLAIKSVNLLVSSRATKGSVAISVD